jgi:hypothetical protein
MAHMVSTLRLNIVVLSMLLANKVTLIVEMGHVVAQVPVAFAEVGIWVVLLSVHQNDVVVGGQGVGSLEWSSLNTEISSGEV